MPLRGHRVQRSGRFADIEAVIKSHGFGKGAPNHPPCPGFYFYSRDGYVIQILPARRIKITSPDRREEIISARRLVNLDSALDVIAMDIEEAEEQQMQEEENKS